MPLVMSFYWFKTPLVDVIINIDGIMVFALSMCTHLNAYHITAQESRSNKQTKTEKCWTKSWSVNDERCTCSTHTLTHKLRRQRCMLIWRMCVPVQVWRCWRLSKRIIKTLFTFVQWNGVRVEQLQWKTKIFLVHSMFMTLTVPLKFVLIFFWTFFWGRRPCHFAN